MADWNETCSQAPSNKKDNTMALYPGEAGYEENFERKAAASEDRRAGCTDMSPRNRREDVRLSDIHRAVDKVFSEDRAVENKKPEWVGQSDPHITKHSGPLGPIAEPDPSLLRVIAKAKREAEYDTGADVVFPGKMVGLRVTEPNSNEFDKNTPSSLKQLRWEIYDLIERYEGDYGRTISMTLRSEIEDLFKKYTHS